jgi:hypothetical protein
MGAAVVDHPEHPLGRRAGLCGHDLFDQPTERLDPSGRLGPSEQAGLVDVISG